MLKISNFLKQFLFSFLLIPATVQSRPEPREAFLALLFSTARKMLLYSAGNRTYDCPKFLHLAIVLFETTGIRCLVGKNAVQTFVAFPYTPCELAECFHTTED